MDIPQILTPTQLIQLMQLVKSARRCVVCAHRGPDGDAVGSSLGMAEYLRKIGKQVNIIFPTAFPDFLRWMPGAADTIIFEERESEARQLIKEADLIVCLDFGQLSRMAEMGAVVAAAKAKRICIDHHLDPDPAVADVIVSLPQACSTCELVFRVIDELGGYERISRSAAACLYTGMMTDTGAFAYNSSRSEVYVIIARLLAKGIDKDRIYRHVYYNYSEHRLRFVGYVMNEKLQFYCSHRASLFTITREEMKRFNYLRGDAEGLVNMPLQVKGMKLSVSLREDTEKDVVRVSLRSVDDFPCNEMAARFFNGGGHLNASGGELPFPLSEAVKTVEAAIAAYEDRLKAK